MADKKVQHPLLATPKGPLAYAWLDKPDDKWAKKDPKAKAKFTATVLIPKGTEDTKAFMTKLLEITGKKGLAAVAKDGDVVAADMAENDKDGSAFVGTWMIAAKTVNKPKMVDAKRKELPTTLKVWSGDICKLAVRANCYDDTEGVNPQKSAKWNLFLEGVQLLDKRAISGGTGSDGSAAFGDEDGYEAEAVDGGEAGGEGQDSGADNLDF